MMESLEPAHELCDTGYPVQEPVPSFAVMLRAPNRLRLVNVGPDVVRCVQERLEQLVPVENFGYILFKEQQQQQRQQQQQQQQQQLPTTGRFNTYEAVLDKPYFAATTQVRKLGGCPVHNICQYCIDSPKNKTKNSNSNDDSLIILDLYVGSETPFD